MNLVEMLKLAGIGCGEHCACARGFVATLDETQKDALGHMIEKGAKKRFLQIESAGAGDEGLSGKPSMTDFMDQLFADAFSPDRRGKLDPMEILLGAMSPRKVIDPNVVPFDGELGDDLEAALAKVPDAAGKKLLEAELRKIIASEADNDPGRVVVEINDLGAVVAVRYAHAADDSDKASTDARAAVN